MGKGKKYSTPRGTSPSAPQGTPPVVPPPIVPSPIPQDPRADAAQTRLHPTPLAPIMGKGKKYPTPRGTSSSAPQGTSPVLPESGVPSPTPPDPRTVAVSTAIPDSLLSELRPIVPRADAVSTTIPDSFLSELRSSIFEQNQIMQEFAITSHDMLASILQALVPPRHHLRQPSSRASTKSARKNPLCSNNP